MTGSTLAGTYYFWPRGDANSSSDGCWIPDTNVNGYIIDLHKNTNPENSALMEKVNSAKANYESRKETYEQRLNYYNRKYLEYCRSGAGTCTLPDSQYIELIRLYDELDSLYAALISLHDTYQQAYDEAKG